MDTWKTRIMSRSFGSLVDFSKLFVGPSTSLQLSIMSACRHWWSSRLPCARDVVINLLPLMLIKACDMNCSPSDVSAVSDVRTAFSEVDYSDPTSSAFRKILLKAFAAPSFLRSDDGVSFLVSVLRLDPNLVPAVHSAAKAQIVHAGPQQLRTYGEIYLRAWKGASCAGSGSAEATGGEGEGKANKGHIEEQCIMPMMEAR